MKNALISVSDKSNIIEIAQILKKYNINILATDGTVNYLKEHNISATSISSLTGQKEILNGRVKTLHTNIYAGILSDNDNLEHISELENNNILSIDFIIVNLYDFKKYADNENISDKELIEHIDIGGVSMIRASAKNYHYKTIITSPNQYADFILELENNNGNTSIEFRQKQALIAFKHISEYDEYIYEKLNKRIGISNNTEKKIENIIISKYGNLRYGENPHQKAYLAKIEDNTIDYNGLDHIQQLSGKELSYNNWLDINSAIKLISEFEIEYNTCAIIKHNIPCGVAIGSDSLEAFSFALDCDPISAFGGIVIFNTIVDVDTARYFNSVFFEIILAPEYTIEALDILKQKANLRIIKYKPYPLKSMHWEYKQILGNGMLIQNYNSELLDNENLKVITNSEPSEKAWLESIFAYRIVKHVKSNAIVIVNNNKAVAISGGYTNRVNAVANAIDIASDMTADAVLASDGFFPFPDSIELIASARISTIIQPAGSIRDNEIISACNKYNISMIQAGYRHFVH